MRGMLESAEAAGRRLASLIQDMLLLAEAKRAGSR
jgi:hypothetical protein